MQSSANVVDQMRRQSLAWEQCGDQRCVFLQCYSLMTENMLRALDAGRFHDRTWATQLLNLFADYYFHALQAYEKDPAAAPAVWRYAHEVSGSRDLHVLQHLLLGINAHINYDLVLTLTDMLRPEWEQLDTAGRQLRYQDHCLVNTVIAETIDTVQDTVIEQQAPYMDLLDRLMGRVDEWMLSRLITHWRQQVWDNAMRLLAAPDAAECEQIRLQIEADALKIAGWMTVV
jgi:hypothetical protein